MIRITSAKCFRPLVALAIIFIVAAVMGTLTAIIYAKHKNRKVICGGMRCECDKRRSHRFCRF